MIMKRIKSLLIGMLFTFSIMGITLPVTYAAEPETVVKTISLSETGYCEVYGYVKNVDPENKNDQITILVTEGTIKDAENLSSFGDKASKKIGYIDQVTCGNNHSFLIKFQVMDKFIGEKMTISIGNNLDADVYRQTVSPPKAGEKFTLNTIANNNVIYGKDVYMLTSNFLTPTNVAKSIIDGGNHIYFKLANNWYDLLNEKAVDSSYLVASNAMTDSQINSVFNGSNPLRYYYCTSNVVLEYEK